MRTVRILFIGNSFTNRNDLPGTITRFAAAAKPAHRVETERVIANGMALKANWNKGAALQAIRSSKWDYVVLQEQSTLPLKNTARMEQSVRQFDDEIRSSGAKTVLYMTWARQHQWDRQPELADVFNRIGQSIPAIVVPVGLAWQHVLTEHPTFVLHDKDGSHPNVAGTYLAACVFFGTLFEKSPEGLETSDSAAVNKADPKAAVMLQRLAWQTSKLTV